MKSKKLVLFSAISLALVLPGAPAEAEPAPLRFWSFGLGHPSGYPPHLGNFDFTQQQLENNSGKTLKDLDLLGDDFEAILNMSAAWNGDYQFGDASPTCEEAKATDDCFRFVTEWDEGVTLRFKPKASYNYLHNEAPKFCEFHRSPSNLTVKAGGGIA